MFAVKLKSERNGAVGAWPTMPIAVVGAQSSRRVETTVDKLSCAGWVPHDQRKPLWLFEVVNLGGQVQAPERHAEQELHAGHDAVAIADARPALHQVQLEAADVIGGGGVRRALQERGEALAAVDVVRCEWGPSWRAFMSSTMRWRNGLIVRLVIETASLVGVDTSIFRKAFAGPLRRSHRRPIMLDPGRAPHQSIAERFSAVASSALQSRPRHDRNTSQTGHFRTLVEIGRPKPQKIVLGNPL